jgi:hypothetical protein
LAPTVEARDLLMRGMEAGLRGDSVEIDPSPLQQTVSRLALAQPTNATRISLALRLKVHDATPMALQMLGDASLLELDRKLLARHSPNYGSAPRCRCFSICWRRIPKRVFVRKCSEAYSALPIRRLQLGSSPLTQGCPVICS